MAIKPPGSSLSITEIAAEFGGSAPYSLSQFYRGGGRVPNGPAQNANIATSGAISMSSFYGAINELPLTLAANTTNYNLYNAYVAAYGTPTGAVPLRLTINSGVTVGATAGNTALTIGQFPSGSTIIIDNNGSIQGFGGAAGTTGIGGTGGDAINANYANQTVVINNKAGASIYGGGGGGGKGGNGGQGSYGYVSTTGGAQNCASTCDQACANAYGGAYYCYSGCLVIGCSKNCTTCGTNLTAYTSGGAGGNGAVGQGYAQAAGTGANGAAGGTNAGAGGKGGNGGGWGAAGAAGNTGASGNYTAGSAGSGGGAAGRYLVKGSSSVTINNSGTVAGGLA